LYLHIGDEQEIYLGKIICILNYKAINNISDFMSSNRYEIIDISEQKVDSVILTKSLNENKYIIYLSSISTSTLKKRIA